MQADELDHIRADIRTAMTEAQYEDHALLPDLLDHLLTALGRISLDPYPELKPHIFDPPGAGETPVAFWAAELLRECQTRAVTQVPFHARELEDDEPHWSDHL